MVRKTERVILECLVPLVDLLGEVAIPWRFLGSLNGSITLRPRLVRQIAWSCVDTNPETGLAYSGHVNEGSVYAAALSEKTERIAVVKLSAHAMSPEESQSRAKASARQGYRYLDVAGVDPWFARLDRPAVGHNRARR